MRKRTTASSTTATLSKMLSTSYNNMKQALRTAGTDAQKAAQKIWASGKSLKDKVAEKLQRTNPPIVLTADDEAVTELPDSPHAEWSNRLNAVIYATIRNAAASVFQGVCYLLLYLLLVVFICIL